MITAHEATRENLTLTDAELAACRPIAGEGAHVLRALCAVPRFRPPAQPARHAGQRALCVLCVRRLGLPRGSARALAGRAPAPRRAPEASSTATPPAARTSEATTRRRAAIAACACPGASRAS